MFTRKGVVVVEKDRAPDEERLLELALEGGAEDLRDSESSWDIISDPGAFKDVRDALEAAGVEVFSAEISMVPQSTIPVDGGEAKQVLNLIEALEELDDVQNVYANFDIPEEVMASLVSRSGSPAEVVHASTVLRRTGLLLAPPDPARNCTTDVRFLRARRDPGVAKLGLAAVARDGRRPNADVGRYRDDRCRRAPRPSGSWAWPKPCARRSRPTAR